VDMVVTDTLYPAICAVRDRTEPLFEAFVKSNRLALMWGFPFGVALSLFAADLVHYGIGDQWVVAIPLLHAFGLTAAFNHIGFNWHAFYRARGNTRPIAIVAGVTVVAFFLGPAPLLAAYGVDGLAAGVGIMTLAGLLARTYYLVQLFPGFAMLRHAARAILPTVPAVVFILLVRTLGDGPRTAVTAAGEIIAFILIVSATTAYAERALLREVAGYLRPRVVRPA
jgi:O-antigen/teichoic acid export membrane protein